MACTQILLPTGPLLLRVRPFDFWGGYGWFQKKKILQTDFEGKNSWWKYYTWRKKIPTLKKLSFVAYDSGKKSYSAAVVCQEKNSITSGFGGKILSPPNHPYHPRNPTHSPSMSNGRCSFRFLCCLAPLFLVFLMFPCSCAPLVSYPASIACERQTFLLALIPLEGRSQRR